tara:strand:- start:247 stop:1131 length:885 start_codon:yes stop_codon:yes gene_type:complete
VVKKKYFNIRKKCPLCHSKKIKIIFSKTFEEIRSKEFFFKHLNNKFPLIMLEDSFYKLSECLNCKIIFQNHVLNKKYNFKFYNDYINHEKVNLEKNAPKLKTGAYKNEIELFEKIFKNKNIKILEFGAGLGAWIIALKQKNFNNIYGVEISKKRRQFLKKNKINCYENLNYIKNKKFDLIYSDQTLEHLVDPGKILKTLVSKLKKDGILVVKIPSGLFLKKKLKNNYYAQKDEAIPLEHINIFTKKSLNFIKSYFNLQRVDLHKYFKIYEYNFYKYLISDYYQRFFCKKIIFKK